MKLALLVIAGGGGTLARYALSNLVLRGHDGGFPWGTLAVNVLGALVFGILWALAEKRLVMSPEMRTVVLVGFLGGFTTFATFAFETVEALRAGQWWIAGVNLAAQNGLGIAALFAGISVGRMLWGRFGGRVVSRPGQEETAGDCSYAWPHKEGAVEPLGIRERSPGNRTLGGD